MKRVSASKQRGLGTSGIGLVLGLAAATSVLAYGGVETLAFAPAQIAVIILATVVFWHHGWPSVSLLTQFVLGTLLVIPLLQLVPLPYSLLAAVSPSRAALADSFDNLLVPTISAPQALALTVNSYETQLALLRLLCYILVFLLAYQLYRLQGEPTALIGVLVAVGSFEAGYGIVQYLTGWKYIFRYGQWVNTGVAAGTYVNQNHFAGLLEMVLPFLLGGLLLRRWKHESYPRSRWIGFVVSSLPPRLLWDLVLFALLCIALIFSHSRMGIAAGIVGMLVVGAITFFQTRRKHVLVILLLILALPAVYALWIGLTSVVERFEVLAKPSELEQDRLLVWRDTVTLIRDYPLFGTGLGTYRWSNGRYQTSKFEGIYEHAHSDYLEFAADMGIPATVLLFVSLWVLVVRVARRVLVLERSRDKILAAGSAGAMAAILSHAITDFNLQIPANAFIFSWIAGTAAALVERRKERQGIQTGSSRSSS